MSTDALAIESVLVAEFGRARVQAYLVDLVEGQYRFLARGEAAGSNELSPGDITIGLQEAVQAIEQISGRTLLRRDALLLPQGANGDGIDSFVAVANVGSPLRLAVLDVGAGPDEVSVVADVTRDKDMLVYTVLPPGRNVKPQEWALQQAAVFSTWQPDIMLLLGGASASSEAVQRMIGIIRSVITSDGGRAGQGNSLQRQPLIWVAAPDAVHHMVLEHLPTKVRALPYAGNAPGELHAILAAEFGKVAAERAAEEVPGFDLVSDWSQAPVVSRQEGVRASLSLLAQQRQQRVAYLDLEDAIGVHIAAPNQVVGSVIADAGLGVCVPNLLGMVNWFDVARWVPFELDELALRQWTLNRALRAQADVFSPESWQIEQAFAREAAQIAVSRLQSGLPVRADLVIGSQRLMSWQAPVAAASVLLDGVQAAPESGIAMLAVDHQGMMPTIGALARVESDITLEVLSHDSLLMLGTCLVLEGGADGQRVAKGRVLRASGESEDFEVLGGRLKVIPLAEDENADIELVLESRARFGASKSGNTVRLKAPTQVRGGVVGIILDARSRPINLAGDARRQGERIQEWQAALGLSTRPAGVVGAG